MWKKTTVEEVANLLHRSWLSYVNLAAPSAASLLIHGFVNDIMKSPATGSASSLHERRELPYRSAATYDTPPPPPPPPSDRSKLPQLPPLEWVHSTPTLFTRSFSLPTFSSVFSTRWLSSPSTGTLFSL